MAYSLLAPTRRMRRRRWLFVALILLIVASLIALAVRYRTERRSVSDYLAVAEDVANSESEIANSLADLLGNVNTVARPELMGRLQMLAADAEQAETMLLAIAVPPPAAEAHGFLAAAVRSWGNGLDTVGDAVTQVLDQPDDPAGIDMLRDSLEQLRVGDVAYAGFLEALGRMDADLVTRDFHTFAYDDASRVDYTAEALALRLRSVYKLTAAHDISVTGLTDPEPVAFRESDGIPVIPFSDGFTVNAVVANQGNEPEAGISVTMILTPADGGSDGISREETVQTLDAGQATTLQFAGIELRPGGLYELKITVAASTDGNEENNTWTMVFFRNEDS